jgi:hypothetical protein
MKLSIDPNFSFIGTASIQKGEFPYSISFGLAWFSSVAGTGVCKWLDNGGCDCPEQ